MNADWKIRHEARERRKKEVLAQIHKGSFLLVTNLQDCKWAIYQAKFPGSDEMSQERGHVFTDEPYDLPDNLSPIRYYSTHYSADTEKYRFECECIDWTHVRAVYQNEADMLAAAQQFRDAEAAYIDAVEPFRARFGVLAKLMGELPA